MRQQHARTILADLKAWIETTLSTLPQKQKLAEAMRYALSRWAALSVYVDDGRVEIDNNIAERAMRPLGIGRNYAFSTGFNSGDRGGRNIKVMLSGTFSFGVTCQPAWSRKSWLALARYGKPDIFNTDQGSQFTSVDFTAVLNKAEIAISMDGKGAWRDNVFVERLWRSIKYEEVYLHAYKTVSEARVGIGRYLTFYNTRRPHSSLDRQTPDQAYFNALTPMMAAA